MPSTHMFAAQPLQHAVQLGVVQRVKNLRSGFGFALAGRPRGTAAAGPRKCGRRGSAPESGDRTASAAAPGCAGVHVGVHLKGWRFCCSAGQTDPGLSSAPCGSTRRWRRRCRISALLRTIGRGGFQLLSTLPAQRQDGLVFCRRAVWPSAGQSPSTRNSSLRWMSSLSQSVSLPGSTAGSLFFLFDFFTDFRGFCPGGWPVQDFFRAWSTWAFSQISSGSRTRLATSFQRVALLSFSLVWPETAGRAPAPTAQSAPGPTSAWFDAAQRQQIAVTDKAFHRPKHGAQAGFVVPPLAVGSG